MTPAIYHKIVAIRATPRFHDYLVSSSLGEEGLFLVKSPQRGIFIGCIDRGTAEGAGCRKIVRSTGTLFGRNSQS
jgi:hypothetical protein